MSSSDLNKVTILQVLPALVTGGVEQGTLEVAQAIIDAGGSALVASSGGPMVSTLESVGGKHIQFSLQSKNPLIILKNALTLVHIIRKYKVDIIHARSRAPAWSALWAARLTGCPLVTTYHGTYNSSNAIKAFYNSVMARGYRVIAISNFIANHIRTNYPGLVPENYLRIIPRGMNEKRFDPLLVSQERLNNIKKKWGMKEGIPVLMLPGRLTRWKGQEVFLEALKNLKTSIPNFQAFLVGSDQGRRSYRVRLQAIIEEANLQEQVTIIDHCDDMPAAYKMSDVVISASTDPEAFGRVLAEAQVMGCYVIAPNHGAAPEVVMEGALVAPNNPQELSLQLSLALRNLKQIKAQVLARHSELVEAFSIAKMTGKTLEVYNELLRDQ